MPEGFFVGCPEVPGRRPDFSGQFTSGQLRASYGHPQSISPGISSGHFLPESIFTLVIFFLSHFFAWVSFYLSHFAPGISFRYFIPDSFLPESVLPESVFTWVIFPSGISSGHFLGAFISSGHFLRAFQFFNILISRASDLRAELN